MIHRASFTSAIKAQRNNSDKGNDDEQNYRQPNQMLKYFGYILALFIIALQRYLQTQN